METLAYIVITLALAAFIFPSTPAGKAYFTDLAKRGKEREERERKRKEEEEKKREERLSTLRKRPVVVYVRDDENKWSSFETILVGEFVKQGLQVNTLSEQVLIRASKGNFESIKNDTKIFFGREWRWEGIWYCAFRLVQCDGTENATVLLSAREENMLSQIKLAKSITDSVIQNLTNH
ncbi:MAG: hypothetical protein WC761_03215 [Candidatus Paceibacterota bacterium]